MRCCGHLVESYDRRLLLSLKDEEYENMKEFSDSLLSVRSVLVCWTLELSRCFSSSAHPQFILSFFLGVILNTEKTESDQLTNINNKITLIVLQLFYLCVCVCVCVCVSHCGRCPAVILLHRTPYRSTTSPCCTHTHTHTRTHARTHRHRHRHTHTHTVWDGLLVGTFWLAGITRTVGNSYRR